MLPATLAKPKQIKLQKRRSDKTPLLFISTKNQPHKKKRRGGKASTICVSLCFCYFSLFCSLSVLIYSIQIYLKKDPRINSLVRKK